MTNDNESIWPYPGSRWWKFDFHTHTPASFDTTSWQQAVGTKDEVTPEKWLLKYMEASIDCVAVTDHNSGAWTDKLKSAYAQMKAQHSPEQPYPGFRELTIFPGVEISANSGVHVLAIFGPEAKTSNIDSLLGAVDYAGTKGDSDRETSKSVAEVIAKIVQAGAIPIPAHADADKGLLRVNSGTRKSALSASTVKQALEVDGLLAVEWGNLDNPYPKAVESLARPLARVLGSDCHNFRGSKVPGSHYTWVKMAEPTLEGLRLALLDGNRVSIRRSDDPHPFDPFALPEHFIETIEIDKARYMGRDRKASLNFSPWFNALIGGRGTGKSSVVHFSRLALRRESEMMDLNERSEPRTTFERFNRVSRSRIDEGGLQEDTIITLTLKRDGVRHFLHWPQSRDGIAVEEQDVDGREASASQSITSERFPVRIFSQGQIAALADESQQALLSVIDEEASTSVQKAILDESRDQFLALQSQVRALDVKLQGHDALTVQIDDVKRKLQRFEEAHHAEILKGYQHRNRQRREIDRQFNTIENMAQQVEAFADTLMSEDIPDGLFDAIKAEEKDALGIVAALAEAVCAAESTVRESAKNLRSAVVAQRSELAKTAWQLAVDKAGSDYQILVNILKEQGVTDPSEYGRLVQERQRLDGEEKRLVSLKNQRDRVVEHAQVQLEKVWDARREIYRTRQKFLDQTLARNPFVCIGLLPYGRDPLMAERSLRDVLGVSFDKYKEIIFLPMEGDEQAKGLVAELHRSLPESVSRATDEIENRLRQMHKRLMKACQNSGDFGARFNKFLLAESSKRPDMLDRIMTWFPEDTLQIQYSRLGDGKDFQPIIQASAGQRAAAMLAFLLAHGKEPLILDQPEDDLDNHLIYDLVVRQIRENKSERQIIVVTHNPNIVVNGDAEMVHALNFSGGQCRVAQSGSLQEKSMREEVCQVMEGGREAFERRYRRLGREVNDV